MFARYMKLILALFVTLLFSLAPALFSADVVNVYTHRHYQIDRQIYAAFEQHSGITVQVLQAKADELIERIVAEGQRTKADLLITVDAPRLDRAVQSGILQPIRSTVLDAQVPTHFRHRNKFWYALTARARVIVYNKERVSAAAVQSYQDLMLPQWRNRVVMRSATHSYNISLLSALIAHNGESAAQRWVTGVSRNFVRQPRGNDRDQMRFVANGGADVTLVNSYYYALFLADDGRNGQLAKKLGISFPNQKQHGAHINISGAGVVKFSKNSAHAVALMEFLTSPAIQKRYAQANYEFPVNPAAKIDPLFADWESVRFDTAAIQGLSRNWGKAVRIFDASNWR